MFKKKEKKVKNKQLGLDRLMLVWGVFLLKDPGSRYSTMAKIKILFAFHLLSYL